MSAALGMRRRRAPVRATVDFVSGSVLVERVGTKMVKLAPGELDDDISDLLQPREFSPVRAPALPALNPTSSISSAQSQHKARKRAAKRKLPAVRIVTGMEIPDQVTGKIRLVRKLAARTGEALIIDVIGTDEDGSSLEAKNIAVWSGYAQTLVRNLIQKDEVATLSIRRPANDRLYAAVARVG